VLSARVDQNAIDVAAPTTMASGILPLFWDLASIEEGKRLEAGARLLDVLTAAQRAHADGGTTSACTDVNYTLRRLVRGLASSRDGARQGFGAALIELLRAFEDVLELDDVLKVMEEAMALHGSMDGAEERDALFGRIFTCASILQSGRLERLAPPRRAALAASLAKELHFCSQKKSFLQELCATLLADLADVLPEAEVLSAVWPQLAPLLAGPLPDWSAHALFLGLRLCRKLPASMLAPLLPHVTLRHGQLLHASNVPALVGPLKAASVAHPRLHAVWDVLIAQGFRVQEAAVCTAAEQQQQLLQQQQQPRGGVQPASPCAAPAFLPP